ncbi:MAG: hydroxyisourate hydrolase [Paracoccaceae bacterium]
MSGRLTTHVLDTSIGFPAKGIKISLYSIKNKNKNFIKELITNSDGRTDQNLLNDKEFFLGKFELNFHVGDYIKLNSNNFSNLQGQLYEIIPVNFNIFSNRNYHIPLLLSPFGYSTYLGS